MKIKHLIVAAFVLLFANCKNDLQLTKIEGKRIEITDTLATNQDIEKFIAPYRVRINKDLDSVLAYAVDTYSKTDGHLNTAIGNFLADVVYEQSNPIFKTRTGLDIDMVLLNHGGIRSIISKGNISARTAFQVMPFENSVIVIALKGTQINELINYLTKAKRAHPISKLKLELDQSFKVTSALINGEKIQPQKTYYVATNDYLYNGGDGMTFFQPNEGEFVLDYKIRNTLIDYFKKTDTIKPTIDDRFTQKN